MLWLISAALSIIMGVVIFFFGGDMFGEYGARITGLAIGWTAPFWLAVWRGLSLLERIRISARLTAVSMTRGYRWRRDD